MFDVLSVSLNFTLLVVSCWKLDLLSRYCLAKKFEITGMLDRTGP